ncbi:alkaline-phosphatase-like protein [Fusarium tricinctum]|uniref:Alkaline-phosphatase-like protein n=1 Tax=Fusarium tricinctum TaxID=61284 RepID=A0A8K0RP90_9HYPO|nr:alkaline-phosphatase-like protein [Fusarium tricinctum]
MFATLVPFCFSTIFVSLTFTKLVHLSIHAKTVSPGALILFLPSLLLPDVLVIYVSRLALRQKKGVFAVGACVLGCIFSFILLGASASQLGFFYTTGNEVKWSEARSYAGDAKGMKILLSGINSVLAAGAIIVVVAWVAKWFLYRAVGSLIATVGTPIAYAWQAIRNRRRSSTSKNNTYESDSDFEDVEVAKEGARLIEDDATEETKTKPRTWIILAIISVFLFLTTAFRPAAPYTMMSMTLPRAMLDMFKSPAPVCNAVSGNWPLADLIASDKWEDPNGRFPGWTPGQVGEAARKYRNTVPEWLPTEIPHGFSKWTPTDNTTDEEPEPKSTNACEAPKTDGTFYNPVLDPMKISNLDNDILDVLRETLSGGDVKIKHVALIMMESYREELFPLQQDSPYHKLILKSHKGEDEDEVNEKLSHLSPVAERLTGKSGNWKKKDGSEFEHVAIPQWNDTAADGYGGINVVGGFTTSSLSFKSMAAIHCGAWSMPVDGFEESETDSYQPCIPQVLDLFNKIKKDKKSDDFLEQQWYPAFFQSITDGYDRQDKFDKKIGFEHIVTKEVLEDDKKDGDDLEEINYFGFAETTLKSHIHDYLKQVKDEGKRMFFSHFTSTTHHPWGVPESFEKTDYLKTNGKMKWHEDFNSYLNAVRFTDAWLGELLQTFDDYGLTNETLVVFVGDHGQAFKEDQKSKIGTYENGHVSNFRVPITFRHPHIPRVQYNANATSLSILPTILDLLINTGSLNEKDQDAASDLIHDYEGQSLIRPYKPSHNGRRAWNFGIVNGGASMLSITSADAPWRMVIPLDDSTQYRFTDLKNDPLERRPLEKWTLELLKIAVENKFGEEAATWAAEADAVSKWWGQERKRLWGYDPSAHKQD